MSYTIERGTGDVIISGFESGIANDPYEGISDIRNINLISIPKEASVNFSTAQISPIGGSGTVSSANAGTKIITYSGTIFSGDAVVFSMQSGLGVVVGTTYWIVVLGGGTAQLYSGYGLTSLVSVTNGTGTFASVTMGQPKYFQYALSAFSYFMLDSLGQVWSNMLTNPNDSPVNAWRYTGNIVGNGNGNGLVYYSASNYTTTGTGYIFVFENSRINYATLSSNTSLIWTYGWNFLTGTTGNSAGSCGLKSPVNPAYIHEALVAPDNKVYFCDTNWISRFYQSSPTTPFVPTNNITYTADQTSVLPFTDVAQCLTPLGNNLLIGGMNNIIYPWDTFSQLPLYPIFVAESNIVKMVTVNTNAYIFVGNRGRIWYTNGSQAQLYKKVPDHLSGTVEPYYTWGGATSNKNQLYFSALVTSNAGVANNNYGGVWAIDLDSKAIRLVNKLSYGTYAGYATAIISNFAIAPAGTGLYIGWNNGASTFGIDTTISAPYSGGQATIDSDLIPIGTFLMPTTNGRVEFKLAVPIVSGESVKLQYRQSFADAFTDVDSNTIFNFSNIGSTWNGYAAAYQNVPFQKSQWIQIRAVLTSTATSPSFVRLTELRLGKFD